VEKLLTRFLQSGVLPNQLGVITPYEGQRAHTVATLLRHGEGLECSWLLAHAPLCCTSASVFCCCAVYGCQLPWHIDDAQALHAVCVAGLPVWCPGPSVQGMRTVEPPLTLTCLVALLVLLSYRAAPPGPVQGH